MGISVSPPLVMSRDSEVDMGTLPLYQSSPVVLPHASATLCALSCSNSNQNLFGVQFEGVAQQTDVVRFSSSSSRSVFSSESETGVAQLIY